MTKCLIKSKEGRFILAHGLRAQSIMLERQERRHRRQLATPLPARKQRGMSTGTQLTLSFLFQVHTSPWDGAAHIYSKLTPQLTKSRASLTDMFKVSKAILDLVKLATVFTMAGVNRGWCCGDGK